MKLLKTYIEVGNDNYRHEASLYEVKSGYQIQISIFLNDIQVARVVAEDNNLQLWNECIS